jgi:hypothetical protein
MVGMEVIGKRKSCTGEVYVRTELSVQEVAILDGTRKVGATEPSRKSREHVIFEQSRVLKVALPLGLILKMSSNRDHQLLAFLVYTNQIFLKHKTPPQHDGSFGRQIIPPLIRFPPHCQYPYSAAM